MSKMKHYKLKTLAKVVIDLLIFLIFLSSLYISLNVSFITHFWVFIAVGLGTRFITRLIFNIYFDVSPVSGVRSTFKLGVTTFIAYLVQYLVFLIFFRTEVEAALINKPLILGVFVVAETFVLIIYRFWRRIIRVFRYTNTKIGRAHV